MADHVGDGADRDLGGMLATIDAEVRPERYAVLTGDRPSFVESAAAIVREDEGVTLVVPVDVVRRAGVAPTGEWAWLTLTVFSDLEAVGLTAAVATALARRDIACNVLAGYHHDHLLVPADRADEATDAIRGLRLGLPQ